MKCLRACGNWLFLLPVCLFIARSSAGGQSSASGQKNVERLAVTGGVFESSGKFVAGADVLLLTIGGRTLHARTDSRGSFFFYNVASGSYVIMAETQTRRSVQTPLSPGDGLKPYMRIVLTLDKVDTTETGGPAIAFSDEPDFAISGVTDWTAVGGHGSDATLRTSEDLARATAALHGPVLPAGNPAEAEEQKLRGAVAGDPQSAAANLALGKYYLRASKYQQALPPLQIASATGDQRAEAEYSLALACNGLRNTASAALHIQRALEHRDVAEYHELAGELAEQQGNAYAAVQHMEHAARLHASEPNYFAWGSELLLHRAVLQASQVFERGVRAYPTSVRMQTGWGSALFAEARYAEASQRLCIASDLQPDDVATYLLLGKVDEAAPTAQACIKDRLARFQKLYPANADANYLYGMSLLRGPNVSSNQQQSEVLFRTAVRLDPTHAAALLQLGILTAGRQQYPQAIDFYKKAIAADPGQASAHYRLAMAYDRTGKPAQAVAERALYEESKSRSAEAVERERRQVKQFLIVPPPRP